MSIHHPAAGFDPLRHHRRVMRIIHHIEQSFVQQHRHRAALFCAALRRELARRPAAFIEAMEAERGLR